MSKRIAPSTAAAFGGLALTAAVVVPVSAQDKMPKSELSGEKTVMVGGAAMFRSKNIIQNAVNSKDHTTLVAAVKAAGLVVPLKARARSRCLRHQRGVRQMPDGTVDNPGEARKQGDATRSSTLSCRSRESWKPPT